MSEQSMVDERIKKLPKWAQKLIKDLEFRVEHAEAIVPWTKPGMVWFTIPGYQDVTRLFVLSSSGAHPVCSIYKDDCLFIGRARRD